MPRDERGDGEAQRLFPDDDRGDKVFAAYEKKLYKTDGREKEVIGQIADVCR